MRKQNPFSNADQSTPDHALGSANVPSAVRATALDYRIPPPILMVLTGLAMGAAQFFGPSAQLPTSVRIGGAAVAMALGGVFGASAFVAFWRAKTTISPVHIYSASSLVTTGVYAISRNPMYVGLTLLLIVFALALSNAWLLAGPLLFAFYITLFQIMPEERAMSAIFGAEYEDYRRRVRRWL